MRSKGSIKTGNEKGELQLLRACEQTNIHPALLNTQLGGGVTNKTEENKQKIRNVS